MKIAQCPTRDRQQLSSILAERRSRRLLCSLQDGPATTRDLAVALAAAERDCARSAVTAADRRRYRRTLQHNYLPRLTDAGLLTRPADGLIRFVPAALDRFEVQFPPLDRPDDPSWPAAAAALGRTYRHPLLAAVAEADGAVSLSRLADRLVEDAVVETADDSRSLAVALHHVDLPKLASVDLLRYDAAEKTVASTSATETVL
jgi:hypothetical protein